MIRIKVPVRFFLLLLHGEKTQINKWEEKVENDSQCLGEKTSSFAGQVPRIVFPAVWLTAREWPRAGNRPATGGAGSSAVPGPGRVGRMAQLRPRLSMAQGSVSTGIS